MSAWLKGWFTKIGDFILQEDSDAINQDTLEYIRKLEGCLETAEQLNLANNELITVQRGLEDLLRNQIEVQQRRLEQQIHDNVQLDKQLQEAKSLVPFD